MKKKYTLILLAVSFLIFSYGANSFAQQIKTNKKTTITQNQKPQEQNPEVVNWRSKVDPEIYKMPDNFVVPMP